MVAAWTKPEHSRARVNDAAKKYLSGKDSSPSERVEALEVINNWRSAHSFPMNTMQIGLRNYAARVSSDAIVVQRLKKFSSIISKLQHQTYVDLARMQDLGGCRVVLPTITDVFEVDNLYKSAQFKHGLVRRDNYIQEHIRSEGYRGIHRVYAYKSDRNSIYNGQRIELQIRTQIQHNWATAVETVDTFTRQALKSRRGEADWLRFFALASSALARVENCPSVPDTPSTARELKSELRRLEKKLKVLTRLRSYQSLVDFLHDYNRRVSANFWLLRLEGLDTEKPQLSVQPYATQIEATNAYDDVEREFRDVNSEAVLIRAQSISALRKAYPNYFADTEAFIGAITQVVK